MNSKSSKRPFHRPLTQDQINAFKQDPQSVNNIVKIIESEEFDILINTLIEQVKQEHKPSQLPHLNAHNTSVVVSVYNFKDALVKIAYEIADNLGMVNEPGESEDFI
jgi:hypothetical protein